MNAVELLAHFWPKPSAHVKYDVVKTCKSLRCVAVILDPDFQSMAS